MLSHLPVESENINKFVLLPGDPGRVDTIGGYLENFKIVGQNREFRVGNGEYKGVPITVCSTGIGCPSTAIAVEELIDAGAETLIRVGTCGGAWRADIPAGSLIIPTASIRDEGTSLEYMPVGYPAVASFQVVQSLIAAVVKKGVNYAAGINRTHDAFYGSQEAVKKWGAYLRDERWQAYDTPILSSEMESSALFVIASLRGKQAGAILAVNAEPEPLRNRLMDTSQKVVAENSRLLTEEVVDHMIQVALEGIVLLAQ